MIHAITVHFSILKNRINKKGLCAIRSRVAIANKRKDLYTGLFIAPKYWDDKLCKALPTTDDALYINNQLKAIQHELEKIYLRLSLEQNTVNLEDVFNEYKGEPVKKELTLIAALRKHQDRNHKLIGIDITKTNSSSISSGLFYIISKFKHLCN